MTRLRPLGIAAALCLPAVAGAQADATSAQSVVKITCRWDAAGPRKAGEMTATGFGWLDKRHVVTALHAVVGCKTLTVYSEAKQDSALARPVRASLEADLALLEFVDRDLGLLPIPHATAAPDTHGDFYTWGYPRGMRQMNDVRTEFAGGLQRGTTTLGAAYGGIDGIDDLFAGQNHPQRGTTILRVTTTLQPGQSGAPILSEDGRVVAIADGGLLGGYLGVNWSIPAHIYLPGLQRSIDPIPGVPSKWAVLYSQTTPEPSPASATAVTVAGGGVEFRLVRQVSLADYVARDRASKFPSFELKHLQTLIPGRVEDLTFDIYEEPKVGTTVAIPTGFALSWNPQFRAFETRSASGAVRHFIGTQRLPVGQPRSATAEAFAARFMPLADWEKPPSAIDYSMLDHQSAGEGGFVAGVALDTGRHITGSIYVQVGYGQFIGLANVEEGKGKWSTLSRDDQFFAFMMTVSQNFTNFTVR